MTKRCSRTLLLRYLLCRGLTFVTLLCACVYLAYYLRLASVTDEFGCSLRVGLLTYDPSVPEKVQCKLIAVGIFSLLRYLFVFYHDETASCSGGGSLRAPNPNPLTPFAALSTWCCSSR